MNVLWSAATIKIIGSGIDDTDFADRLSRQVGDHDVQTTSVSTSDSSKSTSVSTRTKRALPPGAIHTLPKGKALLLATPDPPAPPRSPQPREPPRRNLTEPQKAAPPRSGRGSLGVRPSPRDGHF